MDTTPPDTTLDQTPTGESSHPQPTIAFSATETGATFECALDGAAFTTCTSPWQPGPLSLGSHAVSVRARDVAGNVDQTPATASWVRALRFQRIAAGLSHACALAQDGALWCWGDGAAGQHGDGSGDPADRARFVAPGPYVKLEATSQVTCAVSAAGALECAGAFYACSPAGGAGDCSVVTSRLTRVLVENDITDVAYGGSTACVLRGAGQLWCFGSSDGGLLGQPGLADGVNAPTPVRVGTADNWRDIMLSPSHACAVNADGELWCWGSNAQGQAGLGSATEARQPMRVGMDTDWAEVHAAYSTTCARKTNGTLWCFGQGATLGDGLGQVRTTPYEVTALTDVRAHVVGEALTACAVTTGGALYCWGQGRGGSLGDGTLTALVLQSTPLRVGTYDDWTAVASGSSFTCGLRGTGQAWCFGANAVGQCGTGRMGSRNAPSVVKTSVAAVGVGSAFACVLNGAGILSCSGQNGTGRLGLGTASTDVRDGFVTVNAVAYDRLAVGSNRSCARRVADGTADCWGMQRIPDSLAVQNVPTPVPGGHAWTTIDVAGGLPFTCATRTDTTLWCWGENADGQLGRDTGTTLTDPAQVGALNGWTAVTTGERFACGLRGTRLYCWGSNAYGQVGVGTVTTSEPVTEIGVGTDWTQVSAGSEHACALSAGGQLHCWGYNVFGQCGVAPTVSTLQPTPVSDAMGTPSGWRSVHAGHTTSCAIGDDRSLWCWGTGFRGDLGTGAWSAGSLEPMRVGTDADWVSVDVEGFTACGVRTGGELACWGLNAQGAFGDGTAFNTAPTAVIMP